MSFNQENVGELCMWMVIIYFDSFGVELIPKEIYSK